MAAKGGPGTGSSADTGDLGREGAVFQIVDVILLE